MATGRAQGNGPLEVTARPVRDDGHVMLVGAMHDVNTGIVTIYDRGTAITTAISLESKDYRTKGLCFRSSRDGLVGHIPFTKVFLEIFRRSWSSSEKP
jgi:hypothetical protein